MEVSVQPVSSIHPSPAASCGAEARGLGSVRGELSRVSLGGLRAKALGCCWPCSQEGQRALGEAGVLPGGKPGGATECGRKQTEWVGGGRHRTAPGLGGGLKARRHFQPQQAAGSSRRSPASRLLRLPWPEAAVRGGGRGEGADMAWEATRESRWERATGGL